MPSIPLLARERTLAGPGFNRWLVPPAALCVHLCIGMAYGFSVFWLPLTRAVGITATIACPATMTWAERLVTTRCDWDKPLLGWMYTLFFVVLGSSAAAFGPWLERAGPRRAGVVSACCWCGGLVIAAAGVGLHQLWLLWFGAGVVGGIGLGLGYISPVSTLVRWFPDRRGMATGMAIMGFGGGAMIGSPLADLLMARFARPHSVGVWETFLVLAAGYFVFMLLGAFAYRIPPPGWAPQGWQGPAGADARSAPSARHYVRVDVACRTRQFWLLWVVLCLNVSAGIGVIGMASPMLQEIFGGRLIGMPVAFDRLAPAQLVQVSALGAGFAGLLSLFNIAGRFFWASLSDHIGRKRTYAVFFLVGATLYAAVPWAGRTGNVPLFVGIVSLILTMYGGGFATVPAYLADLFGTQMVGAIHGRLLTAWSVAGILGPVLVNYLNEHQVRSGVPRASAYDQTMYLLAGLLVVGFVCNSRIGPLPDRFFVVDAPARGTCTAHPSPADESRGSGLHGWVLPFWLLVASPLAWGASMTLWQTWRLLQSAQ